MTMDFNEKLQELRKQKGLTQEELAASLYVSRTAVSKWESGRGYPGIDSLKAIAGFFSVTVDELLSCDKVLTIAENDQKRQKSRFCDLVFGFSDLLAVMLIFLPIFADRSSESVRVFSLLNINGAGGKFLFVFLGAVIIQSVFGVLLLALQNCEATAWVKGKKTVSFALSFAEVLGFTVCLQPYPAVYALVFLVVKVLAVVKQR